MMSLIDSGQYVTQIIALEQGYGSSGLLPSVCRLSMQKMTELDSDRVKRNSFSWSG